MRQLNGNGLILFITILLTHLKLSPAARETIEKCIVSAPSSCQKMESSLCLDATLTYSHFYPYFFNMNQSTIHHYLNSTFSAVRKIDRCDTMLESLLCPLFFPKCDGGSIILPSLPDVCRNFNSCKLMEPILSSLCLNTSLFPSHCDNKYKDMMKYTHQPYDTKCPGPMLVTHPKGDSSEYPNDDPIIRVPGIKSCAFNCTEMRFPTSSQEALTNFIFKGSLITSIVLSIALLSWIIDWKKASRYPSNSTFWLCSCLFVVNVMFLYQFWKSKREIACRSDWTIRYSLPSENEELHCLTSFMTLYCASTAALVWLIIKAVSWSNYFSLKSSNKESRQTCVILSHPHLSAWSLPFVFIIIIWSTNGIDGSYLLGICYTGINSWPKRIGFSLVPIFISVIVSEYHFALCIYNLYATLQSVQKTNKEKNPHPASKRKTKICVIKRAMFNILNLMICIFASLIVVIWANITEYNKNSSWQDNLTNQVNCLLNLSEIELPNSLGNFNNPYKCNRKSDGSVDYKEADLIHIYSQLCCLYLISISAASWTWTRATLMSWRRLILRCVNAQEIQMPYKVDVEALHDRRGAYQRVPINNNFICHGNAIADPVCMNLTSHEMSNTSNGNLMNYPLNVDDAVHLEMMNLKNSKGQRRRKKFINAIFKKSSTYDASSISDVSVFRSQNASSFKESFEMNSARNSQLSLQDMKELKETVRRQRRKTRSVQKPHKFSHRHSDTSTQSLASNAFVAGKAGLLPLRPRGVSQATSTDDLLFQVQPDSVSQYSSLFQQAQNIQQQILQQNSIPNPIMNMSVNDIFCGKNQNFGHNLASFNNIQPPNLRNEPSPCAPMQTSTPYNVGRVASPRHNINIDEVKLTHGMIDNGNKLVNPFTEKRKPETTPIQSSNSPIVDRLAILRKNLNIDDLSDFIHGMIDQTGKLVDPLGEKRKPDAKIPWHTPAKCIPYGINTPTQSATLVVRPQSYNVNNIMINTPCPPQLMPPFQHENMANFINSTMMQNQGHNLNFMHHQMTNMNNQLGNFLPQPQPQPQFNNSTMFQMANGAIFLPIQPTPACPTLEELKTIVEQRQQLLPICTQVPTDSELDNFSLNRLLRNDSDTYLTDADSLIENISSRDKISDNSNLMIQQEVTERIKRIEERGLIDEGSSNEQNSSREKASVNSNRVIQQEVTERIKRVEEAAEKNNSYNKLNDLSNNNNNKKVTSDHRTTNSCSVM